MCVENFTIYNQKIILNETDPVFSLRKTGSKKNFSWNDGIYLSSLIKITF